MGLESAAVFFGVGAFCLGLIVGSFLNVCIYRLPREESIVYPPSHCPSCYQAIRPRDNIPVLSYIILRGRCRSCGARISAVYPLVELLSGALFAFYYWRFVETSVPAMAVVPAASTILYYAAFYLVLMAFVCALVVVTFIDFKYFIIPDEVSLGGLVLALAASFAFTEIHESALWAGRPHFSGLLSALLGAAVGAGIIYGIGGIGKLLLRKEAMGFGDVKLIAMIGAFVGWQMTVFVIFFSALLGAVYGVAHLAITGRSKMPYGPFLAMAALFSLLFENQVVTFIGNMVQAYRFMLD
ncbi:MAG: prepilin peptidase [Planctomycetota bacterium]